MEGRVGEGRKTGGEGRKGEGERGRVASWLLEGMDAPRVRSKSPVGLTTIQRHKPRPTDASRYWQPGAGLGDARTSASIII